MSIAACAFGIRNSATWHYKMTVKIDTPEGIKTGTAVREVYAYRVSRIPGELSGGFAKIANGEAVMVDLGKRGKLFALMCDQTSRPDYAWHIVTEAFPYKGGYLTAEGQQYYSKAVLGPVELGEKNYPMFVKFEDLNNPLTIKAVRIENSSVKISEKAVKDTKTFSEAFGEGVALKSVTLELTKDPVEFLPVEKWLGWLPDYQDKQLDGNHIRYFESKDYVANSVSISDFTIKGNK